MCAKSLQWCLTLCNPMDYNPTASSCPLDSPDKNTGVELLFPSPGDLPYPGIKPASPVSPAFVSRFFTASSTWEARVLLWLHLNYLSFNILHCIFHMKIYHTSVTGRNVLKIC